ncbi:MAG: hypothetical protein KDE56_17690, partial [Anaerolineales bacterium]|nr:hypothetical protein [Anaerolineales bacterium]
AEQEAARLGQFFADQFPEKISFRLFPRRINYPFYPVLGVMGVDGEALIDHGVRIIGLPIGYQMTSLIAALQVVSFRGQTLEPVTRIKLARLKTAVNIQILTTADNETGALVAKHAFGLAVASPHIRAYLIMADAFPEAAIRYSASTAPHIVINERVHISGVIDEAELLHQISLAL